MLDAVFIGCGRFVHCVAPVIKGGKGDWMEQLGPIWFAAAVVAVTAAWGYFVGRHKLPAAVIHEQRRAERAGRKRAEKIGYRLGRLWARGKKSIRKRLLHSRPVK